MRSSASRKITKRRTVIFVTPSAQRRRYIVVQGKHVKIVDKLSHYQTPLPGGREACKMFSRQARKRFLEFIAKVDWEKLPAPSFITLTYPDDKIPDDNGESNDYRWNFHKRLERLVGYEFPLIWRKEFIDRKSGTHTGKLVHHFHLLTFAMRGFRDKEVREHWRMVLDVNGALATDARRCMNGSQAAVYLAKYLGKGYDPASHLDNSTYLGSIGRQWGVHRVELLPQFPKVLMPVLDDADWKRLRALAAKELPEWMGNPDASFTLLGENAERFKEAMGKNSRHAAEDVVE